MTYSKYSGSPLPVVILCGGEGTRFREETKFRPKPLITIGEYPILWHVMSIYGQQGFKEFILCLGYKGAMIKEYFLNYEVMNRNFSIRLGESVPRFIDKNHSLQWEITVVDTGGTTQTGSRLKRIAPYITTDNFMVTYADGLANINLHDLLDFHLGHGRVATLTAVRPSSQFGELQLEEGRVINFREKPLMTSYINGGFFVFHREIFNFIGEGDHCVLERDVLSALSARGELHAYTHDGFWQCLDTFKDQQILSELWQRGDPPWTRS